MCDLCHRWQKDFRRRSCVNRPGTVVVEQAQLESARQLIAAVETEGIALRTARRAPAIRNVVLIVGDVECAVGIVASVGVGVSASDIKML